jgi:hypothetical protein
MGDRHILKLKCTYCNKQNEDVWYAPTCNDYTFNCCKCNKKNFITSNLKAVPIEQVTINHVKEGFLKATNISWDHSEVNSMCEDIFKEIK